MHSSSIPATQRRQRFWITNTLAIYFLVVPAASVATAQFATIETIAGNGRAGVPVLKGKAIESPLSNPFGVQPEEGGSLIIASYDQHVIYRLDPSYSHLERIAGTGEKGLAGRDGEMPSKVKFNQPHEVQVDAASNIFIADTFNNRVGMIDGQTGRWKIVAGTGESGFSGDGGDATAARINQAYSIAVIASDLFVADLGNHRIRHVNLNSGVIDTICGTGEKAMPTSGELAVKQPLAGPRSLAVDEDNLWIVLREGNSVWRLDRKSQRIFHVAGTGEKGFSGDGGPAVKATFNGPKGVAVQPGVAVFVADTENHAIRRIDLASGIIATVVGTGQAGYNGEGDAVQTRQLARPHGVCCLQNGQLLIGDSENHRLRLAQP